MRAPCDCCAQARENPAHTWYCPSCLHCGARLIQSIGRRRIPVEDIVRRRRQVLADWMAHGHPEARVRELAAMDVPALSPLADGQARNSASERPPTTKRR